MLYTSKLFFGKYNTRIVIKTEGERLIRWVKPSEVIEVQTWCQTNLPNNSWKIRDYQKNCRNYTIGEVTYYQNLYITDVAQTDQVLKKFGNSVIEVTQPLDQDHKNNLEIRNLLVVRSSLIYKKYQHVVYFKYDRTQELNNWLQTYFVDEPESKLISHPYWPRLYLVDQTHLTTVKLMWQEKIDYIKTVQLLNSAPLT